MPAEHPMAEDIPHFRFIGTDESYYQITGTPPDVIYHKCIPICQSPSNCSQLPTPGVAKKKPSKSSNKMHFPAGNLSPMHSQNIITAKPNDTVIAFCCLISADNKDGIAANEV